MLDGIRSRGPGTLWAAKIGESHTLAIPKSMIFPTQR